MQKVKKSWNASGKRHAISRGANEKPSVSQFEMLKPVIQFATDMSAEMKSQMPVCTYPSE